MQRQRQLAPPGGRRFLIAVTPLIAATVFAAGGSMATEIAPNWGLYLARCSPAVLAAAREGVLVVRYHDDHRLLVEAPAAVGSTFLVDGHLDRCIAVGRRGTDYLILDPGYTGCGASPDGAVEPLVLPASPGLREAVAAGGARVTMLPQGPLAVADESRLSADGRTLAIGNRTLPLADGDLIGPILDRISLESYLGNVQHLQAYQTRYSFADSLWPPGQWIHDSFHQLGYTDVRFDTFTVRETSISRNVIAVKPGLVHPEQQIVVGGHYDSVVNFGHPMQWAPGADDNASGTSMVLELARILANEPLEYTVVFIAFGAEEQGLDGSWHYAAEADTRGDDILVMLNADMIANVEDAVPDVMVYRNTASIGYAELMASMATAWTSLQPVFASASGNSDHWPFMQHGYRAVMAHEGDFSGCWHRPCDTWDAPGFDAEYAVEVVRMVGATLLSVAVPLGTSSVSGTRDVAGTPSSARPLVAVGSPGRAPLLLTYRGETPLTDSAVLAIYDVRGRMVARHALSESEARTGELRWDGRGRYGDAAPAGIYLAQLTNGGDTSLARVVLLP